MAATLALIAARARGERAEDRIAKALADFDYASLRRLERTRLLVRAGPALGLMGTLIPLSPGARRAGRGRRRRAAAATCGWRSASRCSGCSSALLAFGISLMRDRLYGQDLSDLEFVAATLREGA